MARWFVGGPVFSWFSSFPSSPPPSPSTAPLPPARGHLLALAARSTLLFESAAFRRRCEGEWEKGGSEAVERAVDGAQRAMPEEMGESGDRLDGLRYTKTWFPDDAEVRAALVDLAQCEAGLYRAVEAGVRATQSYSPRTAASGT